MTSYYMKVNSEKVQMKLELLLSLYKNVNTYSVTFRFKVNYGQMQ